jgi:cyclic pyranopterin phosphate synthase
MKKTPNLTHLKSSGEAHMVDISEKPITSRIAIAVGSISMSVDSLAIINSRRAAKGDVLSIARIAGIIGTKKTSEIIPLCHPLSLSSVSVDLSINEELPGINIAVTAKTTGKTGVEMEALTGVSVAALTIYDMIKAIDKHMVIGDIRLKLKDGGKSGRFEV